MFHGARGECSFRVDCPSSTMRVASGWDDNVLVKLRSFFVLFRAPFWDKDVSGGVLWVCARAANATCLEGVQIGPWARRKAKALHITLTLRRRFDEASSGPILKVPFLVSTLPVSLVPTSKPEGEVVIQDSF